MNDLNDSLDHPGGEALSIRDQALPPSVAQGRARVKVYGEEKARRAAEREAFETAIREGRMPRIGYQAAVLGKGAFDYRDEIKKVGGSYKKPTKTWLLKPVEDPARREEAQGVLNDLARRDVDITWIGAPGMSTHVLLTLREQAVKVAGQEGSEAGAIPEDLQKLAGTYGLGLALDLQNPSAQVSPLGRIQGHAWYAHPIGIPSAVPAAPEQDRKADPAKREEPKDGTPEDPWKGQRWVRLNIPAMEERLLGKGGDSGLPRPSAAHFKVFLILLTHMDEWNVVQETQQELAGILGMKPSRFSEALKELEALKCIQRFGGRTKAAHIRVNPGMVTRTTRVCHAKVVHDWDHDRAGLKRRLGLP
ncbi:hypothetical protein [Mesoterricola silvestris]|uniref:Uncharacterized protein n=1 Tax=Mesoterricola silvestris TaxID=2927979 RepID=A0AA48H176_9BACT|nr:hypothetical protein [Mesoterricola silvestris]BDU74158.1 hypothetical protein METEAL_33320 [Mesoterricola silvestris]